MAFVAFPAGVHGLHGCDVLKVVCVSEADACECECDAVRAGCEDEHAHVRGNRGH
jgi:hypothetical protein